MTYMYIIRYPHGFYLISTFLLLDYQIFNMFINYMFINM